MQYRRRNRGCSADNFKECQRRVDKVSINEAINVFYNTRFDALYLFNNQHVN